MWRSCNLSAIVIFEPSSLFVDYIPNTMVKQACDSVVWYLSGLNWRDHSYMSHLNGDKAHV